MQLSQYTEKYANELRRRIMPLFVAKQPTPTTQRCGVRILPGQISLLRIDKTAATTQILAQDDLHYDTFENIPVLLPPFLARLAPLPTPTYWVLEPDDYQLFLIESLPVTADEFQDALRWRVRGLINYAIEDASIDSFMLPPKKNATNHMVVAVVTKRQQIGLMANVLIKSGLNLSAIDIPELAMRNLTALHEQDEKSTAFIYFFANTAILNITREKTLYFTRRFTLPVAPDGSDVAYESFCLEILRYFDYFQSQWRLPTPTRIFVAAEKLPLATLATKLSQYLLLTVTPFTPKSTLAVNHDHLLTLGCTLREDQRDATPRN